jgi:hypothetical protein
MARDPKRFQEVSQELLPGGSQNALWMKLDALKVGIVPVPDAHNRAIIDPSRNFENVGTAIAIDR